MDNDIKLWLYDILNAIDEINSYYVNKPKLFEDYVADTKTKRAIDRDLEIIGEAVNRIIKKERQFKIDNAKKIVATRNRIIHGYDMVSDDLIWSIVINHIPKLENEVRNLLNE